MAKRAPKKKADAPSIPKVKPPRKYAVEWVAIDSLKPKSFQNPNRMTPRERAILRKSIEEEGIVPPLLVRLETDEVVDGEHRWEIARDDLHWDEVPVVRQAMTDAQARIIARRRIHARGTEVVDYADQIMRELADLDALDQAQDSLMLSDEEIARFDKEIEVAPLPVDEDEPLAPKPAATAAVESQPRDAAAAPAAGVEPLDDIAPDLDANALDDALEETRDLHAAKPTPRADGDEEEEEDADEPEEGEDEDEDETPKVRPPVLSHRVNVLFMGDEAEIVQRLLGRAPGARILEMCRYWEKNQIDKKLLEE